MKENKFQASLIRTIKNLLPGCIILKNDPKYIQGIPDLLILYGPSWAALEVKRSEDEEHQPNQDYYIELMSSMSFAEFIYPENCQEILNNMINYLKYSEVVNKPFNQLDERQLFIGDFINQNNYSVAA